MESYWSAPLHWNWITLWLQKGRFLGEPDFSSFLLPAPDSLLAMGCFVQWPILPSQKRSSGWQLKGGFDQINIYQYRLTSLWNLALYGWCSTVIEINLNCFQSCMMHGLHNIHYRLIRRSLKLHRLKSPLRSRKGRIRLFPSLNVAPRQFQQQQLAPPQQLLVVAGRPKRPQVVASGQQLRRLRRLRGKPRRKPRGKPSKNQLRVRLRKLKMVMVLSPRRQRDLLRWNGLLQATNSIQHEWWFLMYIGSRSSQQCDFSFFRNVLGFYLPLVPVPRQPSKEHASLFEPILLRACQHMGNQT